MLVPDGPNVQDWLTTGKAKMAVNLTPQYHEAEEQYKKAIGAADKLEWLQKMWVLLPKHKASEKLQADLKTRLSDLREEAERPKGGAKKTSPGKIPRQGAGQIVLVGAPNGGKSQLLAALTSAKPDIAPYPFTTRMPQAGMMTFENIRLQLIDTPPITADQLDPPTLSLIRQADGCALIIDLSDDDGYFAAQAAIERLEQAKTYLSHDIPEGIEDWSIQHVRTLIVATRLSDPAAQERLEIMRELAGTALPIFAIDSVSGENLEVIRRELFNLIDIIRIYPKKPGKPADRDQPITINRGGNVLDFAAAIHGDLPDQLKSARVWGPSAPHDGQTVPKDHVIQDGDTVELQV